MHPFSNFDKIEKKIFICSSNLGQVLIENVVILFFIQSINIKDKFSL